MFVDGLTLLSPKKSGQGGSGSKRKHDGNGQGSASASGVTKYRRSGAVLTTMNQHGNHWKLCCAFPGGRRLSKGLSGRMPVKAVVGATPPREGRSVSVWYHSKCSVYANVFA